MSAHWAYLAGWCSCALIFGLRDLQQWRTDRKRNFDSTSIYAAEQGWPETDR